MALALSLHLAVLADFFANIGKWSNEKALKTRASKCIGYSGASVFSSVDSSYTLESEPSEMHLHTRDGVDEWVKMIPQA